MEAFGFGLASNLALQLAQYLYLESIDTNRLWQVLQGIGFERGKDADGYRGSPQAESSPLGHHLRSFN